MKKTLLGLGLIALALLLLFKDALGLGYIPFWPMVGTIAFGILAFKNFSEGEWISGAVLGVLSFFCANSIFHWMHLSLGTLIVAAILIGWGSSMIFKPKRGRFIFVGRVKNDGSYGDGFDDDDANTIFGNRTRYINDDNFVGVGGDAVFSGTAIYFDNAVITGDTASFTGDAVFSRVKLFVPKNWKVEFTGDRVFSTIDAHSSGAPTDKTLVVTGDYVFSRLMIYYI